MSLERAQEVLRVEARAIEALIDRLDQHFETAVEMILSCKGRVILTGMGKSGTIAQKVSGTLSSTGTPAYTVHPAEVIHGDAGMILPDDIVVVLSNSGESEEVLRTLPVLKRIGCRSIAIVGDTESTLADNSDCVLDVGVEKEACPLGLAPTASTTAALAMGDALAMTVMDRRGFSREDYGLNHPGGTLGKALMKVGDCMRSGDRCPVVSPDDSVQTAIKLVTNAQAGAAIVEDREGRLVGIFTDGDLRRTVVNEPDSLKGTIQDVMTKDPTCVTPDTFVAEAIRIAKKLKVDDLPVVDGDGRVAGYFTVKDQMAW